MGRRGKGYSSGDEYSGRDMIAGGGGAALLGGRCSLSLTRDGSSQLMLTDLAPVPGTE